jgi:NAD(P)-dependent dehydrogenase (short-subunit alcohol dehydrogenase family)
MELMDRTYVVTGAASGIGAATARYCRALGGRVIACDLHGADVVADLTSAEGRAALVEGVTRLSEGRIDAIVANAGGGPPETSISLNFFGAVATLEGLRPLLKTSSAPRAVAVSSVAALQSPISTLVEACLKMDEAAAIAAARDRERSGKAKSSRRECAAGRCASGFESLRHRQICPAALVPKSGGQTRVGRRRDSAECDWARFFRHAGRRPRPVGSQLARCDGAARAVARSLPRPSRRSCGRASLVRERGELPDDGADSLYRRRH